MLTRPDHSRPRPRPKPFHNANAYDKIEVMKSCFSSTLTYATYTPCPKISDTPTNKLV